jgi:serine/threonine protein phosphatase PrpC
MSTQWLSSRTQIRDADQEQAPPAHGPAGKNPLDCGGFSQRGRARAINEDYFRSCDFAFRSRGILSHAVLLVVADGLGGEAAGEHASRIATNSLAQFVKHPSDMASTDGPDGLLRNALIRAHLDILSDGKRHVGHAGMATTLTAALVLWPTVYIVHAGDSRAYRLRDGSLKRLTTDHTVEQQLRDRGLISPAASATSRYKHILWNHLGGDHRFPEPEVAMTPLESGDALLLATDGLTDLIPDQDLVELASRPGSAESISRRLVHAARDKGARDDATALFAQFGTPPRPLKPTRGSNKNV